MYRRQLLAMGAAIGTAGLAGCTIQGTNESARSDGPRIALDPVVDGLTFPTGMAFLPDDSRLICERAGRILRHTASGTDASPILELGDRLDGTDGEKGLLGIAIDPSFADTRRIYLRYSAPLRDHMPAGFSHTSVVASFTLRDDLTGVRPEAERNLLEVAQPGPLHNAGDLAFGPDGNLYIPFGDGRRTDGGEDGDSWWYEKGEAAQNTVDNLRGGILRITPNAPDADRPYDVPGENPLVGQPGRDEYFAWGLRNPYRISFDGGHLFVADVGEHSRESVYLVERGENYGWPMLEGSSCSPPASTGYELADNPLNVFNPKTWLSQTNRISPYKVCPQIAGSGRSFPDPIAEYERTGSRAITGGHVYRGTEVPALEGAYIFGDYVAPSPILMIEDPTNVANAPLPIRELRVTGTDDGRAPDAIVSFARDPSGDVYVLTTAYAEGSGRVQRIVAPS